MRENLKSRIFKDVLFTTVSGYVSRPRNLAEFLANLGDNLLREARFFRQEGNYRAAKACREHYNDIGDMMDGG